MLIIKLEVCGRPHRTPRGMLSILLDRPPVLLSPTITALSQEIKDEETKIRNKHLSLLDDRTGIKRMETRANILGYMRKFLADQAFVEVHTPIIAKGAGGAVARPFMTTATELSQDQLALRISPELWLKRLIIGGMERIYEIGPCFRNEGQTGYPKNLSCN